MAYSYDGYGLSHARLLAIQEMLQKDINTLTQTFEAHSITQPIVSTAYGGTISDSHVQIGLLRAIWEPTATDGTGGPLRICVVLSDNHRGTDFDAQMKYFGDATPGMEYMVHTSIMVYFHSDVFRDEDPDTRALREEIAMARTSDWIRNVCNSWANRSIPLLSTEVAGEGEVDYLKDCHLRVGFLGRFAVGFGQSDQLVGLHFLHRGMIAG